MINNETVSDENIVERVLQGRIDDFKILVERYQNSIFSIGMRFLRNEADSLDFMQDVFLKAFDKLETYKGIAPFKFWLVRIAYNYGINLVKGKREERTIDDSELQDDRVTPERLHLKEEKKKFLMKAIEDLPHQYRVCVDFYFFESFSYNEISEITGYPVNTIKSNVFRAKQILRDSLRGSIAEDYYDL